jgi:hypothetical protein
MNALRHALFLALCLLPLACRASAPDESVPCTCGTPEADLQGCAHHKCLAGERNPANVDCVCGTLTIGK